MFDPFESHRAPVTGQFPVLEAENHLRDLNCEGVSIGRSGGPWEVRSRGFLGGQLLICEPREAFAMRARADQSRAVVVIPLENGTGLVHQGNVIPDGGLGFSMPGTMQVVHAGGATRFALVWIDRGVLAGKALSGGRVFSAPGDGHFGRSLKAIDENNLEGLAEFVRSVVSNLAEQLSSAEAGEAPGKPPRRLTNRMRLVATLWDFVASRLQEDITLDQLEQVTGKSSRTLEYAFTEIVGRTPIGFLKALRLQKSRRMLLEGQFPSVKRAAAASGLWHFGRFSIDYRLHFGELPSDTLKKALEAKKPAG